MTTIRAHAIPQDRMAAIWRVGQDERGNPLQPHRSAEAFPLRCCLTRSGPDTEIALISFSAMDRPLPWAEAGPVFVHADPCEGYADASLPADLRTGPRVLRPYRADGSMDYSGITVVEAGTDLEPVLSRLLEDPVRHEVHVRSHPAQCYTYRVTREGAAPLA
jgi:hypothetical protein